MSTELLVHMQSVPHCPAGTPSTQLQQWIKCTPVRIQHDLRSSVAVTFIVRSSPLCMAVKYVTCTGAVLFGRYCWV
jgi:hypothetical protein